MILSENFKVQTERLILRIPKEKDLPHIFSATRHPGFNEGMLWEPPKTLEELIPILEKNREQWKICNNISFTIEDKISLAFLGRISIRETKEKDTWNIGFWTHPESQNQGVITEAIGAILQFGFLQLQANKIEACYALWNKASERVLEKNGFSFQRFIEKGFKKKGKWVEENMMEISREAWDKRENKQL